MASKRKIATYEGIKNGERRKAVVYYDSQWQDNIVKYYKGNQYMEDADSHHYDDRQDAQDTARSWTLEFGA